MQALRMHLAAWVIRSGCTAGVRFEQRSSIARDTVTVGGKGTEAARAASAAYCECGRWKWSGFSCALRGVERVGAGRRQGSDFAVRQQGKCGA
jgi:hypothetical protein